MRNAEYAPVINWMTDWAGLATFISKTWLVFTGREIDQELGRGWLENIHPDDFNDFLVLISSSPTEREEFTLEIRLRHSSGVYRRVVNSIYPNFTSNGQFSGWVGTGLVMDENASLTKDDELYRLMSENMNELVCLISPDALILYVSPSVKTLLGYSPEELTGKPIFDFFFPNELKSEFDLFFENVKSKDGPNYFEIHIPTRSGDYIWLETDTRFIRDEEGQLLNLQIVSRDITARKQNEVMLHLQNEIGTILWENSDLTSSLEQVLQIVKEIEGIDCGGVYLVDPDTHNLDMITYSGLSPEFVAIIGHIPADHPTSVISKSGQAIYISYEELVAQVPDGMEDLRAPEKLLGLAMIPIIYNKELIAVFNLASHTCKDIPKHSRQILEFLSKQIGAMIARNRAETALRESEEKFRSFFEQTTDTFSLVDEKGYIIEWNHASELLTGISQKDAIGKIGLDVQFELLPPERRSERVYQKMKERFASINKSGEASFFKHILEGEIVNTTGNRRSFQQVIFPIQTSKGFMIGSSGRDVTQQKMVEQAEREQRNLTEALMISSSVLNSSLKMDDVFEAIFEQVNIIVPHQGGSLMLINRSNGKAQVYGAVVFQKGSYARVENGNEFPFRQMPVLVKMFETKKPVIIDDTRLLPDWIELHQNFDVRAYLGAPICIKNEVIGFLNLSSAKVGYFEARHADWLLAFANQAAMAIENARLFSQVEQLAVLDELTNVYNRRGLKQIGDREVERAIRFEHPLSALFMDIDHFKEINDNYSHAVGDQVIQSVASISSSLLRSVDIIARYGGEEFVFLLPETELKGAAQTAERLRMEINKTFVTTDAGDLGVTVSIGTASLNKETISLESLIGKADQAVHTAKASGRNQVVVVEN